MLFIRNVIFLASARMVCKPSASSFACPGYVRIAYCVSHDMIIRSLPAFRKLAEEYGLTK